MNQLLSPWSRWLDGAKYGHHLDRVRSLQASVVVSATGRRCGAPRSGPPST
jgi:hypothetical protein